MIRKLMVHQPGNPGIALTTGFQLLYEALKNDLLTFITYVQL